jgi:hypothetical protein
MIKRKIMEKKVLFVLAFAMLFIGMTVSSCSSDEDAPDNSIPRPNYPIYGDYIRDAKGEAATVYYENWLSNWALLDSDGNRYYFNLSSDSVDHAHFESLVKNGVLADDAHVKFDGKVYSTSDKWKEAVGNRIPDKEKTFVLMEPYTITKVE